MGGIGKTQLASEYAYAHSAEYDLVWWITADEPALIADQFAALAARLGLAPDSDPDAVRAQVDEALRGAGRWLLIFDNADAMEDVRASLPGGPLSPGVSGPAAVGAAGGGRAAAGTRPGHR
jgi:hypothetical protein